MRQPTQHTVCDCNVIYDTELQVGAVLMHPETLMNIWNNTNHPVHLKAGKFDETVASISMGLGVGSRHPRAS